jgi:hypothetical protein
VDLDQKIRTQGELPLETDADAQFPIYDVFAFEFRKCIQTPQLERSPE